MGYVYSQAVSTAMVCRTGSSGNVSIGTSLLTTSTQFNILGAILNWGILSTVFDVGTSLAVMYSVQRGKARLFVVSVV